MSVCVGGGLKWMWGCMRVCVKLPFAYCSLPTTLLLRQYRVDDCVHMCVDAEGGREHRRGRAARVG